MKLDQSKKFETAELAQEYIDSFKGDLALGFCPQINANCVVECVCFNDVRVMRDLSVRKPFCDHALINAHISVEG